jgi:adenine-specific DNA-methyltransferase
MIEQMDYIETVTCERVQKVIENQDSDDSFVYLELLENNQKYITLLQEANTTNDILKIKEQIEQEAFYKYEVDFTQFDVEDFSQLSIDEQKQMLLEVLDLNHLYVNLHSMEDNRLSVIEDDKQLTKQFY